jgi:GntR family transcriptional repressor for pyruvate dehydrogenase complex
MPTAFDFPIRRDSLHEQVADRIQGLVIDESLRPGDRLPGERDLAERVGVSRTVVREAIHLLRVRGLVEVRPGSGTYIRELSLNDAAAPIGLLLKLRQVSDRYADLHEIRGTLEVDIASLAAERATDEDIAALEAAIEGMAAHPKDADQFTRYDLAFHEALAAATQNDLYSVLLTPITDLLLEFRLAAYGHDAQGSIEGALTYHGQILNRIKARDPKGARQAMRDHLRQARSLMEAARQEDVNS